MIARIASRFAAIGSALVPRGIPPAEIQRSPASRQIGRLAVESGFFGFHFEQRASLPSPEEWMQSAPEWVRGVRKEEKYGTFRLDLPIVSFHPGHRAKWSAHELCHLLVGFGWAPDATGFFFATAARLAELLPVALWYFFDEAFLRRCDRHRGGGPLFREFCPACEECAAEPSASDARAEFWISEGLRFIDRELAAIARGRGEGRIISSRWATLDLADDGIATAHLHGPRYHSELFHRYADRFDVGSAEWSSDLDALTARVTAVTDALLGETVLAPLAPSPAHGRWRWIFQDIGWRLLQAEAVGVPDLTALIDAAAGAVCRTTDPQADIGQIGNGALTTIRSGLAEIAHPVARRVLQVGYSPGDPGVTSLREGLESVRPITIDADSLIVRLCAQPPERVPLARRWARLLQRAAPGPVADLARFDAALSELRPIQPILNGGGDGVALADQVVVGIFPRSVLEEGATGSAGMLLAADAEGEIIIAEISLSAVKAIQAGELSDELTSALADLDLLVPTWWSEHQ